MICRPAFFLLFLTLLLVLGGCSSHSSSDDQNGVTMVYLVRHAEKVLTDTTENPPLTEKGKARAQQLVEEFREDTIHALYSTHFIRNRTTLEPLAAQRNLPLNIYEAHDYQALADKINTEHPGETVVVVGHSDTLLPIIEAFGAKPPVEEIKDQDYDYIFKITLTGQGKANAEVRYFQTNADTSLVAP